MSDRLPHIEVIKEALDRHAEALFRGMWGEPIRAHGAEWRAKDSSAYKMNMQGAHRGAWYDFKAGHGGSLLDAFAIVHCGLDDASADFPRVKAEAAKYCGLIDGAPISTAQTLKRKAKKAAQAVKEAEEKTRRRAATVSAIRDAARPIEGTPAQTYLASRAIVGQLPQSLSYAPPFPFNLGLLHPGFHALVVCGEDNAGRIRGGQRVLITPSGEPVPFKGNKPSFGDIKSHPARFPAMIEGGPLCVVESPEAALSVWQATGYETWAVFGVGQFQTAPLPLGRKIILCPDRDPPTGTYEAGSKDARDKEKAARAFKDAARHHVSEGRNIWIALAPEPVGSKHDLNDTHQRAGLDAVKQAIDGAEHVTPRKKNGTFTGGNLTPFTGTRPQSEKPLPLTPARMKTGQDVQDALADCMAWDETSGTPAPVHVIKSDPGLGKSTMMREALAGVNVLPGDVHFYSPTLAGADDGASHAENLKMSHAVTRGRPARNPATDGQMCARPQEVERAGKLGQPIGATLCRAIDDQGRERLCPFYAECGYQRQLKDLPPGPVVRFEAHNYLNLPDPAQDRTPVLRIIDETFWAKQGRKATITIDDLTAPRSPGKVKTDAEAHERTGIIADLIACATDIASQMRRGLPLDLSRYSEDDFAEFAKAERWGETRLPIMPDSPPDAINKALDAQEKINRTAGAKAAFWGAIRKAKLARNTQPQDIVFIENYKPRRDSDPRNVVKVFWDTLPPRDVPVIILDADAQPELIEAYYPGAVFHTTRVSVNADVTQITDHNFSKRTLKRKATRDAFRQVIAVERMRDEIGPGGGVLVGATRAIVKLFFEDAGHSFEGMTNAEVSAHMMGTKLHGVHWAWLGPATLGSNRWQNCTTVLVMGREEWPVDDLESAARCIKGEGLDLIEPDENGNKFMPEIELPFMMADGTTYGVKVWCHPDPLVRAIQFNAREDATRQLVERLRLAQSPIKKRVVIACNVPIPGLPVDHALTWDQYAPSREVAALAESGGALRLSPQGLSADAPQAFNSPDAAKSYLKRGDVIGGLFGGHTVNIYLINGMTPKRAVLVSFKMAGVKGRFKTRAILLCEPAEAEAIATQKWGPLNAFEVERIGEAPAPAEPQPPQPPEPPCKMMKDGPTAAPLSLHRKPTAPPQPEPAPILRQVGARHTGPP